MNRHLLVKNLNVFLQNFPKNFAQNFLTDPNDYLKNRCHFKLILCHAAFQ